MPADLPRDELERLSALGRLQVLDTPAEEVFDRITRLAARLFSVPIAAITFIDQGRQWFKSRVGLDLEETVREALFCDATLNPNGVIAVPDATADQRFADSPLVRGPPHIRFYAGAPLVSREGRPVGTIAIIDQVPRAALSTSDAETLRDLAAMVVDALEQRLLNLTLDEERRQLSEQRRFADLILEGSAEGIFAIDRQGRCTLWNAVITELTGIPAGGVVGRDLLTMDWPLASERPANALRDALAGKAVGLRDEVYLDAAGEEHFFAAHVSPLHDSEGRLVGAIGFVRDTTMRRQLEDQLRQAQKLESIGRLTGTVAHDFNNILTVIIGNLERARPRAQDDPRLARMLEHISAAAARGEKLTQQLLAFARRQRLEPQPVDINLLIGQLEDMLKGTLPENIELRLNLAPRLPRAIADPHQLDVALLNLALNARAAMPRGGTLTVETRLQRLTQADLSRRDDAQPGEYVMIALRDTGTGMSAQVKRRIFEPFYTTKPRGQGTGLGLSQVYGFVMQSRGHIQVDSKPGGGTSVMLFLPLAPAAAKAPDAAPAEFRADPAGGTVLVVEDSEQVRNFAMEILRELGYGVVAAVDGDDALRRIREHPEIEIVFSDVVMPGKLSGLDLARELRRTRPELTTILTTGYTESIGDIEQEGFALLLKPYRPAQLAHTLQAAMAGKAQGTS